MSDELKIYKLLVDKEHGFAEEIGWINDEQLCVWLNYYDLEDFAVGLSRICGDGIFDDGGFNANLQDRYVCIDLCEVIGDCVNLKDIFPKEEYEH